LPVSELTTFPWNGPLRDDEDGRRRHLRMPARSGRAVCLGEPQVAQRCLQAFADNAAIPESNFVHPLNPFDPTPLRQPSITNTRTPGSVRKHSRAHFSTSCGGAIANVVNGRPFAWVKMLPSEIKVFPVPHSATAAAHRASSHRFVMPMIANA
jgi:hypothetical protein